MDKDTALQVTSLRFELKRWEKSFAAAHGGRKPGREDITKDARISIVYREYHDLKKSSAQPGHVETPKKHRQPHPGNQHSRAALQERSMNVSAGTQSKSLRRAQSLDSVLEEEQDDAQEVEPTPAFIRYRLGPTPQRDGQVLGIFDMASSITPSKGSSPPPAEAVMAATPSKSIARASPEPTCSETPPSLGKRFFLEAFASTPLKRKRGDEAATPSTARRLYATPSFLRRNFPLTTVDEDSASGAPSFKKRGLVRSLSSIIQGLRKHEEKRMDDEWDIMNEIEREEQGDSAPREVPNVRREESQAPVMPLGPDQALADSESELSDAEKVGVDGKPRKPWKKKGLKRQTRRVIMRPVMHKQKTALEGVGRGESEGDTMKQDQSTRDPDQRTVDNNRRSALENDVENPDDGQDDSASETRKKRSKAAKSADDKSNEAPKRGRKKVSAHAHANFRKLKIKNKNSKANGRGRKYGRR